MAGAEVMQLGSRTYRVDEHYHETGKTNNLVSRVRDEQEFARFIIKRSRPFQNIIESYYVFQDLFFFGTRKLSSVRERYRREAEILQASEGLNVPLLTEYYDDEPAIVRRYIPGRAFRQLESLEDKKLTLEGALQLFQEIHERGQVIGDGHPKNALLGGDRKVYWTGFAAIYDYNPNDKFTVERAQAIDILKLIHLAYQAISDKPENDDTPVEEYEEERYQIVEKLITSASKHPNREVRWNIKELLRDQEVWQCCWYATRLPKDGVLKREIINGLGPPY
ncbi:MAG: hypothetical protein ABIG93_00210 [archaeon]|nr:hypothetical protein [Nanoarchaeota archaeon]